MKGISKKHPIIFEIILFMLASLLAVVVALILNILGCNIVDSTAIARILIGIALIAVFHGSFKFGNSFTGLVLMLPALLLAIYKIPYHFISGGGTPNRITVSVLLVGLAPAVFEEVLFRGIFISNLKKRFDNPTAIVMISAVVFSLEHLTNMGGMSIISLFLQLIMALVVGIVLGAIYLYTSDLISVILAHFAVDVLGGIFYGGETTPYYFFFVLAAILLFETVYGFLLMRKITAENKQ